MDSLAQLFEETLKDVYYAENAILKALPKMAKKTENPELRKAFEDHAEQTKGQVKRLEQVFKIIGKKASAKECHALKGLVEETEELMSDAETPEVLHAGLIGCAQAVEHYEMARYGTLKAWAEQLGMQDAVKLLDETLQEEKQTDEKLTALATSTVNADADMGDGPEDSEDEDEDDEDSKVANSSAVDDEPEDEEATKPQKKVARSRSK
jgi:ferritin-like metal-binding protein YciE